MVAVMWFMNDLGIKLKSNSSFFVCEILATETEKNIEIFYNESLLLELKS